MRVSALEQLTAPGGGTPLRLSNIVRQRGDYILEGSVFSAEQGIFPIQNGILNVIPTGVGRLSMGQATNLFPPVARFYENPWRVNSLSLLSRQPLNFTREKEIFRDFLGTASGGIWLDLAASTALYGRWLAPVVAPHQGEVISLDFSPLMLRQAQKAIQREGHRNISLVIGRGEHLPFAADSVAGVVCGGSLNEFGAEGIHRVLQEVQRVLRPGGSGVFMHLLTAPTRQGKLAQDLLARPGGIEFWSRPTANALFANAGLRVERTQDFGVVAFTKVVRR